MPEDVDVQTELDRIKHEQKDAAATAPVIAAQQLPNGKQNGKAPADNPPPPAVATA